MCRAVPGTSTSKGGLSSPPELGPFFREGVVGERCAVGVNYQPRPAAVGSAFWPRGAIQPGPGLLFGPTGNSVAAGRGRARVRPHVTPGRLRAMRRRGVGRSTQTDQEAQGQNRSHGACSHVPTVFRVCGLPAIAYRTEYIADAPSAPDCDSALEPPRGIDRSISCCLVSLKLAS